MPLQVERKAAVRAGLARRLFSRCVFGLLVFAYFVYSVTMLWFMLFLLFYFYPFVNPCVTCAFELIWFYANSGYEEAGGVSNII